MNLYKTRKIEFNEILEFEDWKIKIYTISKIGEFNHPEFYEAVKKEVPKWLLLSNSFESSNDKIGFLILHSGTEGIFSLINWWVGKNMLNTHVFMTNPNAPANFTKISGDGLVGCIWELEVINHERVSWIYNILKQESNPNFSAYLKDVYNAII